MIIAIVLLFLAFTVGNKLIAGRDALSKRVVREYSVENVTRVCVRGEVDECIELHGNPAKITLIEDNGSGSRKGLAMQIEPNAGGK